MATADYFRSSGADLIDVGCTPGLAFPHLASVVQALRGAGHRVSIDSFDPAEIRTAVEAGAEMVLSVNRLQPRGRAEQLKGSKATVVVIPDLGEGIETLDPSIEALERVGRSLPLDPIIEPIGYGFMASLGRYAEVRRRYPGAGPLMGIGNITELTAPTARGQCAC